MTMQAAPEAVDRQASRRRWIICGLLFAAVAINYIDRQMIGILKPTLQADLKWSEVDYANIVLAFQTAYAVGFLIFGRIIDKVGVRIGYAAAFAVWTAANVAHGMMHTVAQFAMARFTLGFGESGSFPASLRAVSEWFPQHERAKAVGIFNAGAAIGPIVTPLVVPAIAVTWGWRAAFISVGLVTSIWLVAWLLLYRNPNRAEQTAAAASASGEPPASDAEAPRIPWLQLLRYRETWAYAAGKFLTDPVWWLYLFWLPDFLGKRHGLDLKSFGPPLIAIYVLADVGSVLGGWASSAQMRRGRSANAARKSVMLLCALAVTPIVAAQFVDQLWLAVLIIGVAAAAHQAWSANLMTLPSDVFPRHTVASVIGIGGAAGAVGGMLMTTYNGQILEAFGSYQPIFFVAGGAYLVAITVIHLLMPKLAAVRSGPLSGDGKESMR